MNKKRYIEFQKDLYADFKRAKVTVSKHYQVKDHKVLTAKLSDVAQSDEYGNIPARLVYDDQERAEKYECPTDIVINPASVVETNEDTWKVILSFPYDDSDVVKEYLVTFVINKFHM